MKKESLGIPETLPYGARDTNFGVREYEPDQQIPLGAAILVSHKPIRVEERGRYTTNPMLLTSGKNPSS